MRNLKFKNTPVGKLSAAMLWLVLVSLSVQNISAQSASPYSRFGLGTLQPNTFSANKAMGGIAAPYINTGGSTSSYINYANPASYASLPLTTFEFGANIDGSTIVQRDSTYKSLNASINHFAIAFVPHPKHNNWAVSVGLLPYSNVNYNFTQHFTDSTRGSYSQVNLGKGSMYKLYAGGAFKTKGFSIGANVGYLFGKMDYEKRIELPDSLLGYNARNITSLNAKGFFYDIGISYQKLLHKGVNNDTRKNIYMVLGATGSSGISLKANVKSYWDRYVLASGTVIVTDTVQFDQSRSGKVKMPFNVGAGAMFGNELYWLLGADFRYANWKDFSSPVNNGSLANSWRISVGGQIIPKSDSRKFLPRLQYRAGMFVGKSEVAFQGKGLNEVAATFGLGIPLISWGRFNFAGEVGTRGTSNPSAIRENYYRFTFGLVLTDVYWFMARKLD